MHHSAVDCCMSAPYQQWSQMEWVHLFHAQNAPKAEPTLADFNFELFLKVGMPSDPKNSSTFQTIPTIPKVTPLAIRVILEFVGKKTSWWPSPSPSKYGVSFHISSFPQSLCSQIIWPLAWRHCNADTNMLKDKEEGCMCMTSLRNLFLVFCGQCNHHLSPLTTELIHNVLDDHQHVYTYTTEKGTEPKTVLQSVLVRLWKRSRFDVGIARI